MSRARGTGEEPAGGARPSRLPVWTERPLQPGTPGTAAENAMQVLDRTLLAAAAACLGSAPGLAQLTLSQPSPANAGGSLGLHRFYLHGFRDVLGWLHPWPTIAGMMGIQRVLALGQDDQLSWLLLPLLGLMVSQAMLCAIVYGLTPDERWDARHNPGSPVHPTRWAPVIGVIFALMIGAGTLMATIAFGGQRYFEYQVEEARKISQ